MKTKIKIKSKEVKELLGITAFDFPKYSTQILNLANQNAQGTRPAVVGQMSELIKEFSGKSIDEWEEWYLNTHPDAIQKATEKIVEMIENFKDVINQIDREMIEKWVYDLVVIKTFIGLRFQEAVLKKVSQILNKSYRLSIPEEEALGIDGYIGDIPVSIKPETYQIKKNLSEEINVRILYYKKVKDGISVDIAEIIDSE